MLDFIAITIRYLGYASIFGLLFTPAIIPAACVYLASFVAPYLLELCSLPLRPIAPRGLRAIEEGRMTSFLIWKGVDTFWSTVVVAGGWMFLCNYYLWSKITPEWSAREYLVLVISSAFLSSMAISQAGGEKNPMAGIDALFGMAASWTFFTISSGWDVESGVAAFFSLMLLGALVQMTLLYRLAHR